MAVNIKALGSLGVTFGYGVETTAGEKPSTFTQLERINNIGGISNETEQLDGTCLEDNQKVYVAGLPDSGGTWTITVNNTAETRTQWASLISAFNTAQASGLNTWFEVIIPSESDACFVIAQPPQVLPVPEFGVNEVLTMEIPLTVTEVKGWSTKVAFS